MRHSEMRQSIATILLIHTSLLLTHMHQPTHNTSHHTSYITHHTSHITTRLPSHPHDSADFPYGHNCTTHADCLRPQICGDENTCDYVGMINGYQCEVWCGYGYGVYICICNKSVRYGVGMDIVDR